MTTHAGETVRCPVYASAPSQGATPGCGSTQVKRLSRSTRGLVFECESCGDWFGIGEVEFDRRVLNDPAQKARHDARLASGSY